MSDFSHTKVDGISPISLVTTYFSDLSNRSHQELLAIYWRLDLNKRLNKLSSVAFIDIAGNNI
jgi:hypothetical protein